MKIYEDNGYTHQQAFQGVNTLRNLYNNHPQLRGKDARYLISSIHNDVGKRNISKKENFIPDEKFNKVCESVGLALHNTQIPISPTSRRKNNERSQVKKDLALERK